MKRVKFDGSKWILLIDQQGFFMPYNEVYFWHDEQCKVTKIVDSIFGYHDVGKVYEIPNSKIYTAVCGPKCGPYWPDKACHFCGGKGVSATFDNSGMQMGGTDMANDEVEKIKNSTSSIEFPK